MKLLRELKRRKVLRTLSLYVVGCWVALQVIEVLSEAGLPPTTMRHLLIAASAAFPLVALISWFFDISADGFRRTASRVSDDELPGLNLADFGLMAGLAAVIALVFYVLSSAPSGPAQTVPSLTQRTLAVLPFVDVELADDQEPIGEAIAGELRNEFLQVAGLRVLGPETSRVIQIAGDRQREVASELGVTWCACSRGSSC
jgi:hypothetical protein